MGLRLTVYDGAGVIGGNKILLETGDTRLFFDFGTTFAQRELYFEEYLRPRAPRGLLDLVTMGLLPPLLGLYREDMLLSDGGVEERMRRKSGCRELGQVDGVLLSHAHIDHSGYISFLRADIPVYCTAMTAVIAKAVQDSGQSDFEKEVCYQTPREENGDGVLKTTNYRGSAYRGRQFYTCDASVAAAVSEFWRRSCASRALDHKPLLPAVKVGSLPVRAYPVDHSIYGAAGFALETELGWIVYTGDLRLHGKRGAATERFVRAAAELKPYLLICEGTHVASKSVASEDEVFEHCLGAVERAEGLVVADFGPRNVERLVIFQDVARETGRKLAILAKDAYLLEAMRLADGSVPDIRADDTIRIYRDVKGAEQKWERELLERYQGKLVDATAVKRHEAEYILCLSFWDMNELVDLDPKPGGLYVYSSSEAYSEEQKIDHDRLRNWLAAFDMAVVGLDKEHEPGYHASGHITGPDLLSLIERIGPQVLLPVHTQWPGFFVENVRGTCQVIVPERGEEIVL